MKKLIYPLILFVFIGAIFGVVRFQISLSAASSSIETRIKELNVPVLYVKTTNLDPYEIEIVLQSASTSKDLSYDDFWNIALSQRIAAFNFRIGTPVLTYTIRVLNNKGETIYDGQSMVDPSLTSKNDPFLISKLDNMQTKALAQIKIDFGGFEIQKLEVNSINATGDTGQILDIQVSINDKDKKVTEKSLSTFRQSLETFLYHGYDDYGIYIVLCHLRITDNQGNTIGDYVKEIENGVTIGKGLGLGPLGVVYPGFTATPNLTPSTATATTPKSSITPIGITPGVTVSPTVQPLLGYPPASTNTPHPYP